MKVVKERNPYLLRAGSKSAHKYSFEMQSGQYLLQSEDGKQTPISRIGTYKPKFRKNFTGFVTPKERYEAAKFDQTALHFTPNLTFHKQNSYYTPMTRKFIGYAQQPYQLKGKKISEHLNNPDMPHKFKSPTVELKKSHSEHKDNKNKPKDMSLILNHSATTFAAKETSDHYFQTSFTNMTTSKPLPKKHKPTCYNYRCKYLQHFTFDEKAKTMASTRFSSAKSDRNQNTLSKSFYDRQFESQKKQFSAIKSIAK